MCHDGAMSETADGYVARAGKTVNIGGEDFYVRVHWGVVNGRAAVIGVDLRSFFSRQEARALEGITDARPVGGQWREVGTPAVRGLRLAEVAEATRSFLMHDPSWLEAFAPPTPSQRDVLRGAQVALADKPQPRRGPPALLSDEELEQVVAVAYRQGGRRPVEAVREALTRLPQFKGRVTREQAKKAVQRARDKAFLPPTERGTA